MQLNQPESADPTSLVAGPDGNVWFTDAGENSDGENLIGRVTSAGKVVEYPIPIARSLNEPFHKLGGIASGADGNIWFTDNGSVQRIAPNGVFLGELGNPGELYDASDLTPATDGSMWFVESGYLGRITSTDTIVRYSMPETHLTSLASGPDDEMWFTTFNLAYEEPRVGWIKPSGETSSFEIPREIGRFEGLAGGSDHNMWGFSELSYLLWRITPQGVFANFGSTSNGKDVPSALTLGDEGDMWFLENIFGEYRGDVTARIGRFITPFTPVNVEAPILTGSAAQGQPLSVTEGVWAHAPETIAYQWLSCDASGESCASMDGQTESTHLVNEGDTGHTLRVLVTAANLAGSVSVLTTASKVIAPALSPTPPTVYMSPKAIISVIGATMTWRFKATHRYTTVESLTAHGLPIGGSITITCHGPGCGFRHKRIVVVGDRPCRRRGCKPTRPGSYLNLDLASLFKNRHLGVGARIAVAIVKQGFVGKSFIFTMSASGPPRVQVLIGS
jgi:hypothetical protein